MASRPIRPENLSVVPPASLTQANASQPAPVLTGAQQSGSTITLAGTLTGAPSTSYTID